MRKRKLRRSKSVPSEQEFGTDHEFNFSVVEDDEEKEIYLLLLTHGIGSNLEW